tara:strand:+ start:286 stop:1077 length:792 start_codon:yes stop_codon:yes gene_type:complete
MDFKNKIKSLKDLRKKLKDGEPSIGSWLQISNSSIAEILSHSCYDWLALDLEHGDITEKDIPNLCNAIHNNCSLIFARVIEADPSMCARVLDLGVQGVIIPKVEEPEQLKNIQSAISYPPLGERGVGFCKANLYGKDLSDHLKEFQNPFMVAMIETKKGLDNIDKILKIPYLDSIFIGPYDLSASLGVPGDIKNKIVLEAINKIKLLCQEFSVSCGLHIVEPDKIMLKNVIDEGFLFLAYSIDSVFIRKSSINPLKLYPTKNI